MDSSFNLLAIVETATVLVTFVMMGSGLPLCLNMYKQKSTANVPYLLFLISVFLSTLGLQYGIMISNKALILINSVAFCIWGTYTCIYILVSKSKSQPILSLLCIVGLYFAHYYYMSILPPTDQLPTLGKYMIVWCTVINIIPVFEIYKIIQEKSTKSCNLPLLCGGTLSAVVWGFYGFLIKDINILFPCCPGLLLSAVKFFLIFLYRQPLSQSTTDTTKTIGTFNKKFKNDESNAMIGETLRRRK